MAVSKTKPLIIDLVEIDKEAGVHWLSGKRTKPPADDTHALADWNEAEHPRDSTGQFAAGVADYKIQTGHTPDRDARQAKIADYKPERPLHGPDSKAIHEVIPGSRSTDYFATPGIKAMHAAMGVSPDTASMSKEYETARNALFAKQPVETVPWDRLTYTQDRVNLPQVKTLARENKYLDKPVFIVKSAGAYHVMNGHHRVMANYLNGAPGAKGHVFDADKHAFGDWDEAKHPRDDHGRFGDGDSAARTFDSESGYRWHEEGPVHEWAKNLHEDDLRALGDYAGFGYGEINRTLRGQPPTHEVALRPMTDDERAALVKATNEDKPDPVPPEPDARYTWYMGTGTEKDKSGWQVVGRRVDEERAQRARDDAAKLDAVISERGYVLPEAIEVNRAAYIPGLREADLKGKVGDVITEPGFTSTMAGTAGGRLDGYVAMAKWQSLYDRHGKIEGHDGEDFAAMRISIHVPAGTRVGAVEAARQETDRRRGHVESKDRRRTESEVLLGSGAKFRVDSVARDGHYKGSDGSLKPVPIVDVKLRYIGGGSSEGK